MSRPSERFGPRSTAGGPDRSSEQPGPPDAGRRTVRLGVRAARVLVAELTRHNGPKSGLLIGATAGSEALTAAIDALLPDDTLTVVGGPTVDNLGAYVSAQGRWV